MQQTIEPTPEIVAQAKCDVERFSERQIHLLSFVPDEKLTWAPSLTARSPFRLIAHSAATNTAFANIITGKMPENMSTPEAFSETSTKPRRRSLPAKVPSPGCSGRRRNWSEPSVR